jgi:beta-lactamase regulating signal transducer with metallopeptidase domain
MESLFNTLGTVSFDAFHMVLNGIWLGLLITVPVWLFWRRSTPTNASTRYAVWWALLICVVALPFVSSGIPRMTFDSVTEQVSDRPESGVLSPANHETHRAGRTTSIEPPGPAHSVRPLTKIASSHTSELTPVDDQSLGPLLPGIFALLLLTAWGVVSSVLLLRVGSAYRQVVRIKQASIPVPINRLPRSWPGVGRVSGDVCVTVARSSEIEIPMAAGLGTPVILIPDKFMDSFNEKELEAILLHEMAHIRRWDDWSQLIQRVIEAVLFFHPAIRLVGCQLNLERELACDDIAMAHTGRPSDYYQCLTRLVHLTTGKGTSLVPGALNGRKQIFRRFERLLSHKRNGSVGLSSARFVVSVAAVCLVALIAIQVAPVLAVPGTPVTMSEIRQVVFAAAPDAPPDEIVLPALRSRFTVPDVPDVPQVPSAPALPSQSSLPSLPSAPSLLSLPSLPDMPEMSSVFAYSDGSSQVTTTTTVASVGWLDDLFGDETSTSYSINDDGKTTVTFVENGRRVTVELEGEVVFSDDFRTVESLSRDGYVDITEKSGRLRREVNIEPGPDGKAVYRYYENRAEKPYDDQAGKWVEELLPSIVRNTGYGSEARVGRILRKDGVDGVLAEIRTLEHDFVIRRWFEALVDSGNLSPNDFARALRTVSRRMDSDYEKAELLIACTDNILRDTGLMAEYVASAKTIDSDYEKRRVITALGDADHLPPSVVNALFELAAGLESDYERAEFLIALEPRTRSDSTLREGYLRAVKGMGSDYEIRRVLSEVDDPRGISEESVGDLLAMAETMDSDYEKAELLLELTDRCANDPALKLKLLQAATTLESDYEIRRVLSSQDLDCDRDKDFVIGVMGLLQRLDSDYEKVEGLTEYAECAAKYAEARAVYLTALDNVDSDYEVKRGLVTLIQQSDLDEPAILDILARADRMSSDYEKSEILKLLAKDCRGNDKLEQAFLDVVESMDSDYEADGLYRKLYRRDRTADGK